MCKSGWRVKEVLREVTLAEIETDEGKQVRVAYQFNRPSDIIDIVVPEGKKSLADLQPTAQEQTLSIEQRMLAPPKLKEFQGDVTMRTGLDGLEGIDELPCSRSETRWPHSVTVRMANGAAPWLFGFLLAATSTEACVTPKILKPSSAICRA